MWCIGSVPIESLIKSKCASSRSTRSELLKHAWRQYKSKDQNTWLSYVQLFLTWHWSQTGFNMKISNKREKNVTIIQMCFNFLKCQWTKNTHTKKSGVWSGPDEECSPPQLTKLREVEILTYEFIAEQINLANQDWMNDCNQKMQMQIQTLT